MIVGSPPKLTKTENTYTVETAADRSLQISGNIHARILVHTGSVQTRAGGKLDVPCVDESKEKA